MRKMIEIFMLVVILGLAVAVVILSLKLNARNIEIEGWEEDFAAAKEKLGSTALENMILREKLEIANVDVLERDKIIERLEIQIVALTSRLEKPIEVSEPERTVSSERKPPEGYTNWYPCEPYLTITDKTSEQWYLQLECETDTYTSIRQYIKDGYAYDCVAIGNMAQCEIGDAWEITLRNGLVRRVICGDWTAPTPDDSPPMPAARYPDDCDTGVLEYIVDYKITNKSVKITGTLGQLPEFGGKTSAGDIVSWKYIGRIWNK